MSILSVPRSVVLAACRSTRVLSFAGIAGAATIGSAACRSPRPGYFGVALIPESQQALVSNRSNRSTPAKPAAARVVKAELREWAISLNSPRVSSGRVTIEVHNSGATAHSFEIEGNGIEERTRPVDPDSTTTLSVELKPGKYDIYCPLGAGMHKRMGMTAKLAVQAGE